MYTTIPYAGSGVFPAGGQTAYLLAVKVAARTLSAGSGQPEQAADGHGGQLGLGQEPGDGGLRDQVRVIGLGV